MALGKAIMKASIVQGPQDFKKCLAHVIVRFTTKTILLEGVWVLLGSSEKEMSQGILPWDGEIY